MDKFHLEFEALGTKVGLAETVPPSSPPAPAPDVPEPALGVRSFSQIDATMSALTGVSLGATSVQTLYTDVRDSLPTTANLLAFGASQQLAIQRLATTYCGEIVANATTCSGFFGACTIAAGRKVRSPTPSSTSCSARTSRTSRTKPSAHTELVKVMNDLGCTNGCTGTTAQTALQATCAATLSSAAVTLN